MHTISYMYIHTERHKGILFSHEKEAVLPFVTTRMNMEPIMLSEISQAEKDKDCMVPPIYGILKKFFLNLETENRNVLDSI